MPGLVFFFQAEDGIRDLTVTGVQTCALPISRWPSAASILPCGSIPARELRVWIRESPNIDRKSTRLNSSHSQISYAVFCLKKKKRGDVRCHLWYSRSLWSHCYRCYTSHASHA